MFRQMIHLISLQQCCEVAGSSQNRGNSKSERGLNDMNKSNNICAQINTMRDQLYEGNFIILPLEMVLNIVSFLDHTDVVQLCTLNWSWNIFIERSPCIVRMPIFKLHFKLHAIYVIDAYLHL